MDHLKYNANTPLYTSDKKAWRVDQLEEVMNNLYAHENPVVIFVHGRGKEPGKSLAGGTLKKGMAVHKIELGYDVSVLMFNWDSAFHGLNFLDRKIPLSHTDAAGKALGDVLSALGKYAIENPATPKPALLVHSMGSIVVQKTIEGNFWPNTPNPIFSSILFSQPDADDLGHNKWLEPLSLKEKVFVTFNKDDHVLLKSNDERPSGAKALGLGTSQPLATSASYINLSNMGDLGKKDDDHEVFGKGAMNGQLYVCNFFTQALTGQSVTLDLALNVETVDQGIVYKLRSKNAPDAPCLKIPKLPKV